MTGNFGFIHEKLEIKILILFILRRVPEPIALEELAGLVMCDDGVGYFDFAQCVAELVQTDHLFFRDDKYSVTIKGVRNGEATENSLPYSVRVKASGMTADFCLKLSRESMIQTSHSANDDYGFTVNLSLSDALGSIMSMELFTGDESQAEALEKGFRKNAEGIYNELIKMMLGE